MAQPDISAATPLTGLLGHPVNHSRSPALHDAWLTAHGIDARYLAFDVAPDALSNAIAGMRAMGIKGLNLTVPHKEAVLAHVDVVDDAASAIGAANTLYWREGKLHATNTDAYGFIENVRSQLPTFDAYAEGVLVLGAGGAARAVLYALQRAGAMRVLVANRTLEKAQTLATEFGATAIAWGDIADHLPQTNLLINATSLGMEGQPELAVSLDTLPEASAVHDIVYQPLYTPLLQAARARGNPIATGLGMLYYQAQEAFQLWHGVRPEVTLP